MSASRRTRAPAAVAALALLALCGAAAAAAAPSRPAAAQPPATAVLIHISNFTFNAKGMHNWPCWSVSRDITTIQPRSPCVNNPMDPFPLTPMSPTDS